MVHVPGLLAEPARGMLLIFQLITTWHVLIDLHGKDYGELVQVYFLLNVVQSSYFFLPGKRPFVCDVCGSTFSQLTHVRTHKSTVHEGKCSIFDPFLFPLGFIILISRSCFPGSL